MRSEALARWDAEMRRFAALSDEERIAEMNEALNDSVGDAVRRAVSGSVMDALRDQLARDDPANRVGL